MLHLSLKVTRHIALGQTGQRTIYRRLSHSYLYEFAKIYLTSNLTGTSLTLL